MEASTHSVSMLQYINGTLSHKPMLMPNYLYLSQDIDTTALVACEMQHMLADNFRILLVKVVWSLQEVVTQTMLWTVQLYSTLVCVFFDNFFLSAVNLKLMRSLVNTEMLFNTLIHLFIPQHCYPIQQVDLPSLEPSDSQGRHVVGNSNSGDKQSSQG